jgi:subtilisin family serine protease
MPRVIGKEQLCSSEKKFFKSIQGVGNFTLFDRFSDIESVVKKRLDESYAYFLAEPVEDNDVITWFTKAYNETPKRLTDLSNHELSRYTEIKNQTLKQYQLLHRKLEGEGKTSEAEYIQRALKYINDDFIYCFDGIVVMGIWGMQLRENLRESLGTISKNLFKEKKQEPIPLIEDNAPIEVQETSDESFEMPVYKVRFNTTEGGTISDQPELTKYSGERISENDIPSFEASDGFEFVGWNRNPLNYAIGDDTVFTAQFRAIAPAKLPWYKRFWNWLKRLFFEKGCLKWLLWLLFILLLLWLLRDCCEDEARPIPSPIIEKPWIKDDSLARNGDGGIYDPGNPYNPVPTPPEFQDILPPNQGEIPPFDSTKIIRRPGNPVIISNRLNILMEDENKSIMDLAKDFKVKYPSANFKVVYYDDVVKRMQIEVPPEEREKLKLEIPEKFASKYKLFVFDESLFEGEYLPNDVAFASEEKSWYLKAINAPKAWDITKGSDKITIAIVDNGFTLKHPEIKNKVVMPYNVWTHSKEIFSQKVDHGTHVAGTALAEMDNQLGLSGIAPKSAFMPIQVANRQGLMTTTSILDGVLYALYQGADVINVSLGMKFTGPLSKSAQQNMQNNRFKEEERLWNKVMQISQKHNAIVVVAAGNENILAGVNPMSRPKNFIVVAAVDKNSRDIEKAKFSNYGEYSTVSAPGVDIYSSVGNDSYQMMKGTSMAAPIITGAIALMKSLKPGITAEQIACVFKSTGIHANGEIGNFIQLDKALQKVKNGNLNDCNSRLETPSSGDVQVLLSWDNFNDLDIICVDPNNDVISYQNKKVPSGGQLEIDMNAKYPDKNTPIENIYWPAGRAPNGEYKVYISYYAQHIPQNATSFKVKIKYGDKTKLINGEIKNKGTYIPIFTFTLGEVTNPDNSDRSQEDLIKENRMLKEKIEKLNRLLQNFKNKNKANQ